MEVKEVLFNFIQGKHSLGQMLNLAKYFCGRKKGVVDWDPIYISAFPTFKCNLNCDMCQTHSKRKPNPYGQKPGKDMDFKLFERVDSVDDAVNTIDRFYIRYHSLRYIGERLVIRLTSQIEPQKVEEIKSRFADILRPGGDMCLLGPLQEESDEPENAHLPRLILDFNRKDFGRLRELIDAINDC